MVLIDFKSGLLCKSVFSWSKIIEISLMQWTFSSSDLCCLYLPVRFSNQIGSYGLQCEQVWTDEETKVLLGLWRAIPDSVSWNHLYCSAGLVYLCVLQRPHSARKEENGTVAFNLYFQSKFSKRVSSWKLINCLPQKSDCSVNKKTRRWWVKLSLFNCTCRTIKHQQRIL